MSFPSIGQIRGQRLSDLLGSWAAGQRPSSSGLYSALRQLVLDARLPPGTRLPAERELAESIGASRTLVVRALDRLREEGLVTSQRGAGSWVTLPAGKSGGDVAARAGLTPSTDPGILNLANATPPAPPELAEAVDRTRVRFAEQLAGHGYYPHGLLELRERIAERFTQRGLPTGPHQVVVTNGAQHAFALTLRILISAGDRVLVEQPTYVNTLPAIRGANAQPVPVPMADDGWDLEAIEATLRQAAPKLAYLIPDFQNPTGMRLDAPGRERLVAALRRSRTTAVVDETLVELDLTESAAPLPMAAYSEDNVITVGSASKTFWGGLRLGWIRAPEELAQRMVVGRCGLDLGSPVFEQLVLSDLLADPASLLRRRRAEVRAQRDSIVELLQQYCPQWSFRIPEGGLALWCRLDEPISSRLTLAAEQQGVQLVPGARFAVHGSLERRLRLPYTLPADQLEEAVRRVARAAAIVGASSAPDVLEVPAT